MSAPSPRERGVSCPACGRRVPWSGNPHRPFCSLTCRLMDLGVWLDEGYRVAAEPFPEEGDRDVP
ncbi:MAG: DNA gyrase inhibitor YacG [Candidatus Rokuibacteriota bacterium]